MQLILRGKQMAHISIMCSNEIVVWIVRDWDRKIFTKLQFKL